jgi:pyruvate dehydrogenase E1 component
LYFRLTTRPVDQALAALPDDDEARERRRRAALCGGYVLRASRERPRVTLAGAGAILPEVIGAADELAAAGIPADVVCLTSADLVFRALQARQGLLEGDHAILDELFPPDRAAPIVAVLDGHPHTLSFLSAIRRMPIASLGVSDFGQSGDVEDLYRHVGIDTDTIVGAALDLLDD